MPSSNDPIADHFANCRVRSPVHGPAASHARSAYAPYASTPIGSVIAVLTCKEFHKPGNGRTSPKPVIWPSRTHPDHTATVAGAASTTSGHDRMARVRGATRMRDCRHAHLLASDVSSAAPGPGLMSAGI